MVRCPRDGRVALPSAMIHLLPCTVDHGRFVRSCQQAGGSPPKSVTAREVLEIATDQRVSQETLRRSLYRMDYLWKRPRHDLAPDPLRDKKNGGSAGRSGPCRGG